MINYIKPHLALNYLKAYLPDNPLIVEAGAFTGSDSIRFLGTWPHAKIHAFEPVPELYAHLCEKTKNHAQITCHQLGLGPHNGTGLLHLAHKETRITQASSLLAPKTFDNSAIVFTRTITIPLMTLDTWAEKNRIHHIDLLWLDLQGIELATLKAAPHILKNIKIIHSEVATIERFAGQPLYGEVKQWLEEHGFTLIAQDFDETIRNFGNIIALNPDLP